VLWGRGGGGEERGAKRAPPTAVDPPHPTPPHPLPSPQVDYKNVMREYGLGPNGGILTALNLFATRFDQVVALLEKARDPPLRLAVLDTPGQIEIFAWSASGSIMTDSLGASMPTAVVFVVDTPRCASAPAFVANILQAASILYRTRLPLLLVFNKSDVAGAGAVTSWLTDWDALDAALAGEKSYAASLSRSLSLVLDEFVGAIPHVTVSAATGAGFDDLLRACGALRETYAATYLPDLLARRGAAAAAEAERQAGELARMRLDAEGGAGGG